MTLELPWADPAERRWMRGRQRWEARWRRHPWLPRNQRPRHYGIRARPYAPEFGHRWKAGVQGACTSQFLPFLHPGTNDMFHIAVMLLTYNETFVATPQGGAVVNALPGQTGSPRSWKASPWALREGFTPFDRLYSEVPGLSRRHPQIVQCDRTICTNLYGHTENLRGPGTFGPGEGGI